MRVSGRFFALFLHAPSSARCAGTPDGRRASSRCILPCRDGRCVARADGADSRRSLRAAHQHGARTAPTHCCRLPRLRPPDKSRVQATGQQILHGACSMLLRNPRMSGSTSRAGNVARYLRISALSIRAPRYFTETRCTDRSHAAQPAEQANHAIRARMLRDLPSVVKHRNGKD